MTDNSRKRVQTQDTNVISTPRITRQQYGKQSLSCLKPPYDLDFYNPENIEAPKIRFSSNSVQSINKGRHLDPIKNSMKNLLKQTYNEQMKREQQRHIAQRKLRIMQEKDYLSLFQKHNGSQINLRQRLKEGYKEELLSQIKTKKSLIQHVKTEEMSYERACQAPRKYNYDHKSSAFRKFYEDASNYQKKVQDEYQHYMREEEKHQKSKNKDKIMNYSPNYQLMMQQKRDEMNLQKEKKQDLRRILDQQIASRQQEKKKEFQQSKIRQVSENAYNPISNPIDYKMDIRNKYIMGEIMKTTINDYNSLK